MKLHFTRAFLCVFATLFLLSACDRKDDSPVSVAFSGTYTTSVEVLSGPPMLQQKVTGTGKSTNLGIVKFVALTTVNTSTAPPFKVSGTCTFNAENGDVFYTTFSGTSTPNADGTSAVEMTHTMTTGGTGKFEKATGTFIGKTIANPKNPTSTITYDGTIRY